MIVRRPPAERGEPHDRSPRLRAPFAGWSRRLRTVVAADLAGQPAATSTLEAFFAEVRWTEDVQAGGQRTLRRF